MVQVEGDPELPGSREQLVPTKGRRKKKAASWGPVVAVRKSKRNLDDNRPIMGRAQEIKRNLSPKQTKGKKLLSNKAIVNSDLVPIAKTIGLDASSGSLETRASLDHLVSLEKERGASFSNDCPTCTRHDVLESGKEQDEIGQS